MEPETGRNEALWKMIGLCLVAGVLVAGMLFPVAGGLGLMSNEASDEIDSVSADLVTGEVPLVSTITDASGVPIAYLFDQNRIEVKPEGIADTMKAAIIAIEDRRFFQHDGVDWRGTTRALLSNISSSGSALDGQGGSTLTMQYVKNYLLYVVAKTDSERAEAIESTPARKLREVRIALQLERELDKQDILARYLNIVFFGNNAYGVAAAAKTYFNTTADKLTIAQAAMLAGMVRSTSEFDPVDYPEDAIARRNLVIAKMAEIGSITSTQAAAAKAEPLGISNPLTGSPNGCVGAGPADGFFCQYVLDYLDVHGIPPEQVKKGGYTIKTTLDRRASDIAKKAASDEVPTTTPGIANAMAIVTPGKDKHRVTALVANRDFGLKAEAGQTSFALPSTVQGFGAGSMYKVFTAGAALEKGLGINTRIASPPTYTSRIFKNAGAPYTVRNAGTYGGSMTLQQALASSPNTAFVALEDRIGSIDPVVDMAYRLGMRDSLDLIDAQGRKQSDAIKSEKRGSFTLGPEPTSPLDFANVGATLMSGGTWCPPTPIESMTDRNGNPVPLNEAPCEQAVPEGLANTLAVGLSKDDLPGGTAAQAASAFGWNRPMLGKTGTTQDNKSAGFVGATPQYSASVMVWPDGSQPRPICDTDPPRLCGNGNIFGGKVPARTWFATMRALHEGLPVLPMPPTDPRYTDGGGANASVPNVIGKTEAEARRILEGAGFLVDTSSVNSNSPRGIVVSQDPSGVALPGDLISLGVSNGVPPSPSSEPPPSDFPTFPTLPTEPTFPGPDPPTFTFPTFEPDPDPNPGFDPCDPNQNPFYPRGCNNP